MSPHVRGLPPPCHGHTPGPALCLARALLGDVLMGPSCSAQARTCDGASREPGARERGSPQIEG